MEFIETAVNGMVYLASCFVLFFLGKIIYQLFHRKIDVKKELVEKDNFAFGLAHVGYFIGLLLAIGSAIIGPSHGLAQDLIDIFLYGILSIVLLNISIIINDKVILRKFVVYKEIIEDRNEGTGIIEAGNAIATGLVLMGAVIGEGGMITALAFWLLGQLILIFTSFVYSWIVPYDVHKHIEKDNVAVGIGFAGALIAIGNLIRYGLMTDFESWGMTLANVGIDVAVGLVLLPIVRYLTDKILLPGQSLTDELINQEKPNYGAATIEAFAYIGGSVLITWSL